MNIGFDAKRAAQNGTGLGNYSRFIISQFEQFSNHQLHLYIPNPARSKHLRRLPLTERIQVEYPKSWLSRHFSGIWRTIGITHRLCPDKIKIYHGLSGEIPLGISRLKGVRSIVTIHDLIFLTFPHAYHWLDRMIYKQKSHYACNHADHIIAVSEFTKSEIIRHFNIPEERISVVYQGCDPLFREPASDEIKEEVCRKYNIASSKPYILYVGTIEPRKNLMLLAKALKYVQTEIQVIAVGRQTAYADKIKQYLAKEKLSNRINFYHDVPFIHLPALYQMAHIFVYPSRLEGFGIPMLEALCSGTPAIGCTGSCLEEAGGPSSVYVDPDSPKALAKEIAVLLKDKEKRTRMIEAGRIYAQRFMNKPLYEDLWKVYASVINASSV